MISPVCVLHVIEKHEVSDRFAVQERSSLGLLCSLVSNIALSSHKLQQPANLIRRKLGTLGEITTLIFAATSKQFPNPVSAEPVVFVERAQDDQPSPGILVAAKADRLHDT